MLIGPLAAPLEADVEPCRREIHEFAERTGLQIATSYRRSTLFDPLHPLYAGDLGLGPNPKLVARAKAADLLVLVGGRLGEIPSQGYSLLSSPSPQTKLVHIHPGAEEIGRVLFPANQASTLPLNPCKEAFDDPAALVLTQSPTVPRLALGAVRLVQRKHLCALGAHGRVERIAVIRLIADQVLRPRLDHVKVEGQLHERDLMMVRGVRGHRQRQTVTIDNRHDFHAFSASRRANLLAATLG